MFLVIAISLIMAVIAFTKGYIFIGVLCLAGPTHGFGMIALIIASILLIINGSYIMGGIIVALILWNIFGLKLMNKRLI